MEVAISVVPLVTSPEIALTVRVRHFGSFPSVSLFNPSVLNVVPAATSHVFTEISWFVAFVVVSLLRFWTL